MAVPAKMANVLGHVLNKAHREGLRWAGNVLLHESVDGFGSSKAGVLDFVAAAR